MEIEVLKQKTLEKREIIKKIRHEEIFHVGNSDKKSANQIIELLKQLKEK